MQTKTVWTIVWVVAALVLMMNGVFRGAGSVYVKAVDVELVNVKSSLTINPARDCERVE